MKKIILLSAIAVVSVATAQNVDIPDANFKAYLVGNNQINTNGDQEISVAEAQAYTGPIICSFLSISNLKGIEAFVNITMLNCMENSLTNLDVSSNTKLKDLICTGNQIKMLNLSNNPDLETLTCLSNRLIALDTSNNTKLKQLFCNNNELIAINIKNGNNSNVPDWAFNTKNNPDLTCIEVDDVSHSSSMWSIGVDDTSVFSTDCYAVATVSVNDIQTPVNTAIYPNPFTDFVTITSEQNHIENVRVYDIKGALLYENQSNNNEINLNLSKLNTGIYFVKIASENGEITRKMIKK